MLERAGATARTARAVGLRAGARPRPGTSPRCTTPTPRWPETADLLVAEERRDAYADDDEAAFAARFHLVHEWRKFLFADPGLPAELLPAGWPGHAAAELFTARRAAQAGGRPLRGPLPRRLTSPVRQTAPMSPADACPDRLPQSCSTSPTGSRPSR